MVYSRVNFVDSKGISLSPRSLLLTVLRAFDAILTLYFGVDVEFRNWYYLVCGLLFEPRSEKTGVRGFRLGPTRTGLCSHRKCLEA